MSQQHGLGRGLSSLIPPKQKPAIVSPGTVPTAAPGNPVSVADLTKEEHATDRHVLEIPVGKILPNPHQPRVDFVEDRLRELADSIKEHGILQPLIVTKRGESYELIAGERRLQAAKQVGLATVPALVRDVEEQQKFELAIIENVQRHDLNPIEEAKAYRRLIDEFDLTQEDVARKMGKSRSLVANTLRLLQLPAEIQRALLEGTVSEGHAKAILAVEGLEKQMGLYEAIIKDTLTVREAEARSRTVSQKPRRQTVASDPELQSKEEKLAEALGTRVRIARAGQGGKILIEYYNGEDLDHLLEKLKA